MVNLAIEPPIPEGDVALLSEETEDIANSTLQLAQPRQLFPPSQSVAIVVSFFIHSTTILLVSATNPFAYRRKAKTFSVIFLLPPVKDLKCQGLPGRYTDPHIM